MGYIGAGPTRFNTADELTVTGDAEFNGDLTVKGTHITLDSATVQTVDLGDNDKIRLGDSDDLQIYHDGSDSYVDDTGTGALILRGNANVTIGKYTGETMGFFEADGAVSLYHNNAIKLATTATGVDAINTAGSSTSRFGSTYNTGANDGTLVIGNGGSGDAMLRFDYEGTNTDRARIGVTSSGQQLEFYTAGNNERMRIDSSGDVGIGTTTNNASGATKSVALNASSGMAAYEMRTADSFTGYLGNDGTNMYLVNAVNGSLGFYTNNSERLRIDSSGNVGIGTSSTNYGKFTVQNTAGTGKVLLDSYQSVPTTENVMAIYADASNGYIESYNNGYKNIIIAGSGGNVGIGHSTPQFGLTMAQGNGDAARIGWEDGSENKRASIICASSSDALQFHTGTSDTERMRLDSSGNLLVGCTALPTTNVPGLGVDLGNYSELRCSHVSTGNSTQVRFLNPNGEVGSIRTNGSGTNFNTSSDYRLKENVVADWDATTRLKQLNPVRFNFIVDPDTTVDGFLAHEVQDVVPEAISGTKDAMRDEEYQVSAATGDIYTPAIEAVLDEDGNEVTPAVAEVIHSTDVERPEELAEGQQWRETTAAVMGTRSVPDYQGIDQSKLVPLLCKTILELEARIVALETA